MKVFIALAIALLTATVSAEYADTIPVAIYIDGKLDGYVKVDLKWAKIVVGVDIEKAVERAVEKNKKTVIVINGEPILYEGKE